MKNIGVYIHIPFCKQKCIYCDFISYADKQDKQERYVKSLIKEIQQWRIENKDTEIDTIYIGGGTPSYLDSEYILEILDQFKEKILPNAEITIEVNPGTVNTKKLEDYKRAGINRLSIGLQSTNNRLLNLMGRIHSFEEFQETYKQSRKVGFDNINVDLMIGLPTQTIQDIKKSLDEIINLDPEHISVYSLIVEENTIMQKLIDEGTLKLPDEELERNMYWYVKNTLELNGYNHYEISNFSKPGFESKHNMNCWNQKEYKGFGIAAHSYINNNRFSNIIDMNKYITNIEEKQFEKNIVIEEKQEEFKKKQEFMLLGLRKIEGISIQEFKNKFVDNPIFLFKEELNELSNNGLIVINEDKIKLTHKGLDLANLVWEKFI
ncbi:MAG: oxygen-independent coproporphyrinogen III oxidase [Clostridia bacterium]|nr:oxygen-independent coproporphyrinogen III oxidase [Clostridia bacterium]